MPRSLCSTQFWLAGTRMSSARTPFAETMRPRIIGTRSSVAPGACSRMKASKRAASADWMSTKKNDGACSGSAAMNWRRRLPSTSITRDQQREPEAERHHDAGRQRAGTMDVGDGEPQRRRARPRQAFRHRHHQGRHQPQRRRTRRRRQHEQRGDALVVGELHRQDRQRRDRDHRQRHIDRARPVPIRRHLVTEQRRDRDVMRAAERPDRKRQCGEQAVEQRQREILKMQCRVQGQRR